MNGIKQNIPQTSSRGQAVNAISFQILANITPQTHLLQVSPLPLLRQQQNTSGDTDGTISRFG